MSTEDKDLFVEMLNKLNLTRERAAKLDTIVQEIIADEENENMADILPAIYKQFRSPGDLAFACFLFGGYHNEMMKEEEDEDLSPKVKIFDGFNCDEACNDFINDYTERFEQFNVIDIKYSTSMDAPKVYKSILLIYSYR